MKTLSLVILVAVSAAPLATAQLLHHWKIDEAPGASSASDSVSGGANDSLTVNGDVAFSGAGGVSGGYVSFDGENDALIGDLDNGSTIQVLGIDPRAFTVSMWVRQPADYTTTDRSVNAFSISTDAGSGSLRNSGFFIATEKDSGGGTNSAQEVVAFERNGDATGNRRAVDGPDVIDGEWHHIVTVFDSTISLFVDGSLVDTNSSGFLTINGSALENLAVGAFFRPGSGGIIDDYFGDIDDLQIYGDALSPEEVTFLFRNPGLAIPEPSMLTLMLGALLAVSLSFRHRR